MITRHFFHVSNKLSSLLLGAGFRISRRIHSLVLQQRALLFYIRTIRQKTSLFSALGFAFFEPQGAVTVSISCIGRCFFSKSQGDVTISISSTRRCFFSETQGAVTVCFQHRALLLFESQGVRNNIRAKT